MSTDTNDNVRSRSEQRSKRKKTNIILNALIILVIALIVFVSYSIFSDGDNKTDNQENKKTAQTESTKDEQASAQADNDAAKSTDDSESDEEQETQKDGEAIITEGGSDSNVIKTIENPSWEPVGTTQSGEHTASYSAGVDWDEQLKALAYGTGIDEGNMVVWFLGNNNKDQNKSIGTVSTKDKSEKYRVYIEWVDGSGWKPTKVEEINDLNIR
ncbi:MULTISPECIES: YrrS family protein [Bacillaceae]|uniref:YrrS family protein n=1 Tax=Bacillaceae TaxID=186817 RepID=UPI001E606AB8|nr:MULTISPECIES: YrrS family protein [Bacillaceae]MCE4046951.1 YrrS family protein [Bacillus sp. Au-Bac7]MCM3030054.1 YrrS family protein [Niallia sp. MER 6]MDL0437577.1 YrrS family protein [Niallia sp. SS-2023]UPO86661.1 YrrS family protein [Niallia sp. Man26]